MSKNFMLYGNPRVCRVGRGREGREGFFTAHPGGNLQPENILLTEGAVTSALQCTSCRSSGGAPAALQGSSGPVKSPKGRALEYLILITFGTKGCLSLKLRKPA